MHSSLEPQNDSVSGLTVALIWPLQRREDAVKTKRKESLYRIFYRRNVQFSRLQRLTASIFWWLCTLFEFSYFYTFSTGHKGRYISDFSFMGEVKCSVCLCFCHFGPDMDTWSIMREIPRWAISQLTFMEFWKHRQLLEGFSWDISQIFWLLRMNCPHLCQINEGANSYYPASEHPSW